jgi:hydroxymethylpyrimidine/phosphomethylpyrimidine kinase
VRVALTIAGSDSSGGAGVQADLRTFGAFSVHGASVVTAITAQNSREVVASVPLEPGLVREQLLAVGRDLSIDAVKTGMLGTQAIVETVAEGLRELGLRNVVVDPLLRASGGESLLEGSLEALLPLASVLTPNLPEAEALLGHPVPDLAAMRRAVTELRELGPPNVVLKGGHLAGDPVDVFWDGTRLEELRAARVPGIETHGTGCVFSAAIAAGLARGAPVWEAVRQAKAHTDAAVRSSFAVGRNRHFLGSPSTS